MAKRKSDESQYTSIKLSLNSILKPQYAAQIKDIIFRRCVDMTKISSLASLLILYKVNQAVEHERWDYFNQDGATFLENCFKAVTQEFQHTLPTEFRAHMEGMHNQFQWPTKRALGNSFLYFHQMYGTNLQNNLNTHCEKRISFFVRLRCFHLNSLHNDNFDGIDVRNIIKDVMKNEDWCDGDDDRIRKRELLWDELCSIGFPRNTHLKSFVEIQWFYSILPFLLIQRQIEEYVMQHADYMEEWHANFKPPLNRPPKLHNFTVIPNCNFHLKHIRLDTTDVYMLTSKLQALPKFLNKITGRENNYPKGYYTDHNNRKHELWDILFDMNKIRRMGKAHKEFYGQIQTDGVSASVLYTRQTRSVFFCLLMIFIKYTRGFFVNIIGIDPGDKTWLAGVCRNFHTGVETLIKISPRRFHWGTRQKVRERKIARLSEHFTAEMQLTSTFYRKVPSPRGEKWGNYIDHQMWLYPLGIAAFATKRYAKLGLEKYIESNREADETAKKITQNQPSLVFLGAAELNPSRPIGIKRQKRCPGVRKLVVSIKKLGHSAVVFVDEYFTSQTCANCFGRFARNTRKDRFKVCRNCIPIVELACLPPKIVTQHGKRTLKLIRSLVRRNWNRIVHGQQPNRLVSKVVTYWKNWQPNVMDDDEPRGRTVVWHRDIVAARCILYKGLCKLLRIEIHPNLMRPPRQQRPLLRNA